VKTLGKWISTQQTNYKKQNKNMKEEENRKKWNDFVTNEKYVKYFK